MAKVSRFLVLCPLGSEVIVSQELKIAGFKPDQRLPGRIFFTDTENKSPLLTAFRANYFLRGVDRVYFELASFEANDFDSLFEGVSAVAWDTYFAKDSRVIVDKVRTYKSDLSSEHAIQSVVHKALRNKLCTAFKLKTLPETGAGFSVRIYLENNIVHILLDTSGEALHRRGYRFHSGEAPLRESVAAVLLYALHWKRKTPLYDAFCGVGTIPIEAALYAHNIPAGISRSFAFEQFKCWNTAECRQLLRDERAKAIIAINTECTVRIAASDISPQAVALAEKNAERAFMLAGKALQSVGSDKRIPRPEFSVADARSCQNPFESGVLLSNIPYGKRLGSTESITKLYTDLHTLPEHFPNWTLGFITSSQDFDGLIDLDEQLFKTKKRQLKSGNLDTYFFSYLPK